MCSSTKTKITLGTEIYFTKILFSKRYGILNQKINIYRIINFIKFDRAKKATRMDEQTSFSFHMDMASDQQMAIATPIFVLLSPILTTWMSRTWCFAAFCVF